MGERGAVSLDVVVLPWLAFGHMIPFLELSKRLAARGHTVTFLSTPRNLARLPPVPANLSDLVRLRPLQIPRVDGLPEGAESTADVPPEKNELLKKACDGLAAPFAVFLADACAAGRKPDWVINDFCHHWLPPIADERKVLCATFHITTVTMNALLGPRWANAKYPRSAPEDFTVPPKWIPFPSSIAFCRREAEWVADAFHYSSLTPPVWLTSCASGKPRNAVSSSSTAAATRSSLGCSTSSPTSSGSPSSPPGSCCRPTSPTTAPPPAPRSCGGSTTSLPNPSSTSLWGARRR
ncbi:hypothetical protein ABZP36_023490 [Zizania latifolia]